MLNVFDVVAFILDKQSPMTAMKLQKIVYYCQVWSIVWDEEPLFKEKIEAWANGPVVRSLYEHYRGQYLVSNITKGDKKLLNRKQKETVSSVLSYYGDKTSQWLSDLTHMEDPWRLARKGIQEGDRSSMEISLASIEEYYSSLPLDEPAVN